MKTLENDATYQGIKDAGFRRDFNEPGLKLKNDLGVSLDNFLTAIGFEKNIEVERERTWVSFKKDGIDFQINYRLQSEYNSGYATIKSLS